MGNKSSSKKAAAGNDLLVPAVLPSKIGDDPNELRAAMRVLVEAIENEDIELLRTFLQTPGSEQVLDIIVPSSRLGEPPLLYAIRLCGTLTIPKMLVEAGANLRLMNKDGALAAHVACQHENIEVAKYFIEKCGLECRDESENTPIVYAASHGNVEVFEYLVSLGADLTIQSVDSLTPLMSCARRGDTRMVESLIRHGVNVDAQDKWGRSALFYSARAGTLPTMKILVELGKCSVNLRDRYGNDAFWMAESRSMYECAMYLFAHGADSASLVKSRGFGSEVIFSRPLLRGDVMTPRKSPLACATTRKGKRVVMFGGYGVETGSKLMNPLEGLDKAGNSSIRTCTNKDLVYVDLDALEEEHQFLADQISAHRQQVHPVASKGKWSPKNKSHRISIEEDGVTCEFTGTFDPACIQADFAFDGSPSSPFAYWEVQILCLGSHSMITMGLTKEKYEFDAHPGWYPESIALHGDDGQIFFSVGSGNIWGPRFSEGDVIGCGFNTQTQEVWFTRNGKFLGVAFKHVAVLPSQQWYPTVGMSSPGEKAKANFGAFPFMFTFDAPMLKFIQPKVTPAASPLTTASTFNLFPELAWPSLHEFDDKDTLLMVGIERSRFSPFIGLLDTNTWKFQEMSQQQGSKGGNDDFQDGVWDCASVFDKETKMLTMICVNSPDNGVTFELKARQLDCLSWTWAENHILSTNYSRKILAYNPEVSSAPPVLLAMNGYIWVWHPLGTTAWRIKCSQAESGSPNLWEEVTIEGAISRTTYYSLAKSPSTNTLFAFCGWDDNAQSNSFHVIEVVDRPTGERNDEGKALTKPVLVWSRPHREGTVPRPRNDAGLFPIDDRTLVAFGGWNGRNYVDDFEIITLAEERKRDELRQLLESDELSDVQILLKDDKSIGASKIVLYSRCSYFRDVFTRDPNAQSVDITSVPLDLFSPLLSYLHTDVVESEAIPKDAVRLFIDGVVNRFAPEHFNRITQELFAAHVGAISTFGKELEKHAWNNPVFSDVEFEVTNEEDGSKVVFVAHRAIICSRSRFFQALCMGGLKESRQRTISISETSPLAFKHILLFLYTKSVDFEEVEPFIVDLLMAAAQYDVSELKSLLEAVIAPSVTLENVASLLLVSDQIDALRLRGVCVKFIQANYATLACIPEFQAEKDAVDSLLKQDKMEL